MSITNKCRGCGQGFDINNKPVGECLNAAVCAEGHTGPFDPMTVIAPTSVTKTVFFAEPLYIKNWQSGERTMILRDQIPTTNGLKFVLNHCKRFWGLGFSKLYKFVDPQLSLENRTHITSEEEFQKALQQYDSNSGDEVVEFIMFNPFVSEGGNSPTEKPVLLLAPLPATGTATSTSDGASRSTFASSQCKALAEYQCIFCGYKGSRETLQAAHFYEQKDMRKISGKTMDETILLQLKELSKYGVDTWNSPRNSICLCPRCHDHFDKSKTIGILPKEHLLIVSESIHDKKALSGKLYGSLHKKQIKYPNEELVRPTSPLLRFRYERFLSAENERAALKSNTRKRTMSSGAASIKKKRRGGNQRVEERAGDQLKWEKFITMLDQLKKLKDAIANKTKRQLDSLASKIEKCGLELELCAANGDCLLLAVLDQLNYIGVHPGNTVASLRQNASDLLREILADADLDQIYPVFEEAHVDTAEEYIESMRTTGWFDGPAILALARHLNLRFDIYSPLSFNTTDFPTYNPVNEDATGGVIRLFFNGLDHYDSLRGTPRRPS